MIIWAKYKFNLLSFESICRCYFIFLSDYLGVNISLNLIVIFFKERKQSH